MSCTCIVKLPENTTIAMNDFYDVAIEGTVEISFGWVDFGIGAYEYWGATGYDSSMGPEDLEIIDLDDIVVSNADGDEIEDFDKIQVLRGLNKKLDKDEKFADDLYGKAEPEQPDEDPYADYEAERMEDRDPNWMND